MNASSSFSEKFPLFQIFSSYFKWMYSWDHNFKYSAIFQFIILTKVSFPFSWVPTQFSLKYQKRHTLKMSGQDNFEKGCWQARPQISWLLQGLAKSHCPLQTCLQLLPAGFQMVLLRLLVGCSLSLINTLCIYLSAVVCWLIMSRETVYFQFLLGKCLSTLKEIMQNELNVWLQLHACSSLSI